MWRGIVLSASLVALLAQPVAGQESADAGPPALRLQKYLKLHVSGGRIAVRAGEAGQSRTVTAGQPESACRQQLQLQMRPPCLLVQYEAIDPAGRLALRVCEKRNLAIERTGSDPASSPSVRYEQPQAGAVKLIISGEVSRELAAPSLWHLILLHPRECHEHLSPLLAALASDWDLVAQSEELEAALLTAAAEADVASDEKSWTRLVDDLGSDHFSRRQSADAALRDGGQAAAAFLSRLDLRTLSAEQRLRVQSIRQGYADGTTDTPQRVALWLQGDRSVWLGLLASERPETRVQAAEHLSRMTGRPIVFDPRGDAKLRELQLAELTRRVAPKK